MPSSEAIMANAANEPEFDVPERPTEEEFDSLPVLPPELLDPAAAKNRKLPTLRRLLPLYPRRLRMEDGRYWSWVWLCRKRWPK